ncbi:MAG: hypothetical protein GY799_22865 [Desulfobulbaceae bacterium]|nr:hypothetical protein [Desulfobulbaceae bacterium]
MRILTTTIGAWPKLADVPIPDWFQRESTTAAIPQKHWMHVNDAGMKVCQNCSTGAPRRL